MVKLSSSALKVFRECARCFWLAHNQKLKRPEGIFPSLPSGMDKVLKAHFDAFRDKGKLPPELKDLTDVKLFDDVSLLSVWTNNFKGITWTDPQGHVLKGAVDYVLVKGKKLIVLDFKTRGYPTKADTHEHYRTQLDLYSLLFQKNGREPADHGYLLFFWPASYGLGMANFKTELIRMDVSPSRGMSVLKQAHDIIVAPKPEAHAMCEYCNYRES